jgi:superfamily II DNA or RNA helicase
MHTLKNKIFPKGGGIYVIKFPGKENIYKIGKSNCISKRISQLSCGHFEDFSLNSVIYPTFENKYNSGLLYRIEKEIHHKLSEFRIRKDREFFKLDNIDENLDSVVEKLNGYMFAVERIKDNYEEKLKLVKEVRKDICEENINLYNCDNLLAKEHEKEDAKEHLIFSPKPFQIDCHDKLYKYFCDEKNERGILVVPPGYGKSYMACFLIRKLFPNVEERKFLIIVPLLSIKDDFKKVLKNCELELNENCLLITYQTYIKNEEKYNDVNFDIVVYDEAHHLTANKYHGSLEIKSSKKLFMSATPKIEIMEDESVVSIESDTENNYLSECESVIDSDSDSISETISENKTINNDRNLYNEDLYGKIIYQENLETSIEKGLLCNYKLFIFSDLENGEYPDLKYMCEEMVNKQFRKRIILFFNTIESSKNTCEILRQNFDYEINNIDCNTSKEERRKILESFDLDDDKVRIICNVNTISEGTNLALTDCIIFAEKRSSPHGIVQNIGRSLRIHRKKDFSIIVMNESMVENMNIIKSLLNTDSRIRNRQMFISNKNGDEKLEMKICCLREIDPKNGIWNYKYNLCCDYELESGKNITGKIEYKNTKIGTWIKTQKESFKSNNLSIDRLDKLRKLKTWVERGKNKRTKKLPFSKWLEICKCYEHENWNENVKNINKIEYKGNKIGYWILNKKKLFIQNKLSMDNLEKLRELNTWVEWENKEKKEKLSYLEWLKFCEDYERETGKNITPKIEYKGNKIGPWLVEQKRAFRNNKLTVEKLEKLTQLNTWKKKERLSYSEWLKFCKNYEDETGKNITGKIEYKGNKIDSWINYQKRLFNKNKLSIDKIDLLKSLKTFQDWFQKNNS